MLDMSALEVENEKISVSSGQPLEIPLIDIEEDPNQPRKEFSEAAMEEMKASIIARSVKTPVSVRPHPQKQKKWILNYGARRYRGSVAAGKTTIPAFIDEAHDDYDQVIENVQREDLKPMELALFIKKRLDAGDKKTEIAKRLGKSNPIITWHAALIDAPDFLEDLYVSGKCTSAQSIYELRALYDKNPERVREWCSTTDEINRRTILDLGDELKGKKKKIQPQIQINSEIATEADSEKFSDSSGQQKKQTRDVAVKDEEISVTTLPYHNPKIEKELEQNVGIADSDKIKKPLLLVEFEGRAAMVLLNRRPSTPGLIRIRYEDGTGEEEVDAGKCKINYLTESEK